MRRHSLTCSIDGKKYMSYSKGPWAQNVWSFSPIKFFIRIFSVIFFQDNRKGGGGVHEVCSFFILIK